MDGSTTFDCHCKRIGELDRDEIFSLLCSGYNAPNLFWPATTLTRLVGFL